MEHHLSGNMNRYPVIVIPECEYLEASFLEELREYVRNGGKLLVIGPVTAGMFTDELGIDSSELIPRSEAFIMAARKIGSVKSDILLVKLGQSGKSLSTFYQGSDFNYPAGYAAASVNQLGKGKAAGIYFNAGTAYSQYRTPVIRDLIDETMQELFPEKLAEVTGSHLVHVSTNQQNGKLYVNLINVAGEHTNQSAIGYDQVPALENISVTIKTAVKPSKILLQPGAKELEISWVNGKSTVRIPELPLHAILEVIQK